MMGNIAVDIRPSPEPYARELDRIRNAYQKRTSASLYSMFEPAQMLAVQERERNLLKLLRSLDIAPRLSTAKILEIGCGSGTWIREFLRWGAQPENITGIDVLSERICEARRLSPTGITWLCRSATNLEDMREKFDLVLQSTVFTSILDESMKRQTAREMLRALTPGGIILWYDFRVNNPRNPDVRGIEKPEIRRLFSGCSVALERLTLAPPLGRPLARWSPSLYRIAATIKPLCSHYLGYIKKN